jgi:hypothetical protein
VPFAGAAEQVPVHAVEDRPVPVVVPIQAATGTAGREIPAGAVPVAIAVTPDGRTAYFRSLFSCGWKPKKRQTAHLKKETMWCLNETKERSVTSRAHGYSPMA